jgi:hypothetical protein
MNSSTKFQATLAMIQTVPQVAESASHLHDHVMLCQLIVFRLLAHLEEGMASYDADDAEAEGERHEYSGPPESSAAPGWGGDPDAERIAGAPVKDAAPTGEDLVAATDGAFTTNPAP